MNRWIMSLSLLMLVACQVGTSQTGEEEQAVTTSGDCIPGGNYAGAKLPALPLWTGAKPPQAGAGQLFLDVPDWRANTAYSGVGFHVAVLTEPGTGKFLWGATIPDGKLSSYRALAVNPNQPQIGDCCRPPPCGCRTCCDPGFLSNWMARNFQESSLRYIVVPDNGAAAAGPLYPKLGF